MIAHGIDANELSVSALLLLRNVIVLFSVLVIRLASQCKVEFSVVFAVRIVSKSINWVGLFTLLLLYHNFRQIELLLRSCILATEKLFLLSLLSEFVPFDNRVLRLLDHLLTLRHSDLLVLSLTTVHRLQLIGLCVHLATLLEVLLTVVLWLNNSLSLLQNLQRLLGRPWFLLLELLLLNLLRDCHLHLISIKLSLWILDLASLLKDLNVTLIGALLIEELWPRGGLTLILLLGLHRKLLSLKVDVRRLNLLLDVRKHLLANLKQIRVIADLW